MLTFSLESSERACQPGAKRAEALFKPRRHYTLRQILDAGLPERDLAWLIFDRAKADSSTVPLIQAWARACCRAQSVRGQQFSSVAECNRAVKASIFAWAKNRETRKGGQAWAYSVLVDLIRSEGF